MAIIYFSEYPCPQRYQREPWTVLVPRGHAWPSDLADRECKLPGGSGTR